MSSIDPPDHQAENLLLRQQLAESQEVINAIRSGSVDAFVADNGEVYTLQSADYVYRILVDTMNQGAVTLGLDGIILYVNREFTCMMEVLPNDVIGTDFTLLVCSEDRDSFRRILQRSQVASSRADICISTPSGRRISVLMSMSTLIPHGVNALSVLITDLTERKTHESTALVRKRLEFSQSAGKVGTFDWDLSSGAVVWTKELEHLFGLPEGGFDGTYQGWAKHVHPEDLAGVELKIRDAVQSGLPWHVEYRIIRIDGQVRWIEAKGQLEKDLRGEPLRFVGINMDVTERKVLQLQLERSNAELAEYAAVASHDLQAPLRTISNYLDILEKRYSSVFDERALRYFDYITKSTTHMSHLISGILEYSKSGGQVIALETVDTTHAAQAALANLDEAIHATQAVITVDSLPTIQANELDLTRLFQNIIGNAIKYCHRKPEIRLSAQRSEFGWTFMVADNGPGIEKQFSERIFKLFQRLTNSKEVPGTGIGLATCKKIVERYGGRIWVESTIGMGSVFYFTIAD